MVRASFSFDFTHVWKLYEYIELDLTNHSNRIPLNTLKFR